MTYGIFKTKRAYKLALKYNLELLNQSAYIHSQSFITLDDVKFIVDNLWLNHFLYHDNPPIHVNTDKYLKIQSYIKSNYSNFF